MSRPIYSDSESSELYERQPRAVPLSISRSARDSSRLFPTTHRSGQPSPTRDSESARRRIAVACSRCRKRKIKCSGDVGPGHGCVNCRNAGTEPGQCQFLRVNSDNLTCALPTTMDWPYFNQPSIGPHMTTSLAPYVSTNPILAMGSCSYPGTSTSSRGQNYYPSASYGAISHRQDICSSFNSGTELFEPYCIPQYLSPSLGSQASPGGYSSQETSRNWASGARYNVDLEQGVSSRVGPLQTPYDVLTVTSAVNASEATPLFPAMGSLVHSLPGQLLPTPSLSSERILPNPKTNMITSTDSGSAIEEASPYVMVLPSADKSNMSAPWSQERVINGIFQNSTTTGSPSGSGKPSTSPSDAQETAFGYIPVPQSPSNTSNTTTPRVDYSSHPTDFSNGRPLSRNYPSTSSLYAYSISSSSRRSSQSLASDGLLLSGQPYTHLQSQRSRALPCEMRRQESDDASARIVHQPPVSSVSTSQRA